MSTGSIPRAKRSRQARGEEMSARLIGLAFLGLFLLAAPARAEDGDLQAQAAAEESAVGVETAELQVTAEPEVTAQTNEAEKPVAAGATAGTVAPQAPLFPDFNLLPDRWRIAPPPYELTVPTSIWDPYNRNPLKGDFPIPGTETIFPRLTIASRTAVEGRKFPIASGVSTQSPNSERFFGDPVSTEVDERIVLRMEFIKGATAYKPFDWLVLIEGIADLNSLWLSERGAVSPDVRNGTDRFSTELSLESAFVEVHLADLSANYDFVSAKIGRQSFNSDFRGLIFQDTNQGARVFGTANSGRYQYNLLYFYQAQKDTVTGVNTFDLRDQHIAVANLYIQDFFFNGWTNAFSFHGNFDQGRAAGLVYDDLGFLARPTPIGEPRPHDVQAYYLGWTSEGHIGRINVSHAFYQALGTDSFNNIAGRKTDINGQLAFLELSYDRDWMRYQTSLYFASGDDDSRDGNATGFDSIQDNPAVAGGEFSFFQRQSIRITDRGGAGLNQRLSLIPNLRSSKNLGQANFVNPGLLLTNIGATAELTPTATLIGNVNYLRFADTSSLRSIVGQRSVGENLGIDISLGLEYRPLLNNNIILKAFGAVLQPLDGFEAIYSDATLWHLGGEITLVY